MAQGRTLSIEEFEAMEAAEPAAGQTMSIEEFDAMETAAPPKMGRYEAGARGELEGLTLGFSGELAGVGSVIGDKLATLFAGAPSRPASEVYREGRDESDAKLKQAEVDRPFQAIGGQLLGGVALPVPGAVAAKGASLGARALRAGAVGAGTGAITGAGKAAELEDVPESAAAGAAIGGTIGAALPVGAAAVGKTVGAAKRAVGAVKGKVAEKAKEAVKDKIVDVAMDVLPLPGIVARPIAGAIKRVLNKPKVAKEVAKAAEQFDFAPDVAQRLATPDLAPPAVTPGYARRYDAAERGLRRTPVGRAELPPPPPLTPPAAAAAAEQAAGLKPPPLAGDPPIKPAAQSSFQRKVQAGVQEAMRAQGGRPRVVPDEAAGPIASPEKIRELEAILKRNQRAAPAIAPDDAPTVQAITNVVISAKSGKVDAGALRGYLAEIPPGKGTDAQQLKALARLKLDLQEGVTPGEAIYRARKAGVPPVAITRAVEVAFK